MLTICLASQKGGATKTTSAVSLAAEWAGRGYRVLLVDADAQSQSALHLGVRDPEMRRTLAGVLLAGVPLGETLHPVWPTLHVVPGHDDLYSMDVALATKVGREHLLTKALRPVQDDYDVCVIDLPPALGTAFANAVLAADHIIVPCVPEPLVVDGVVKLLTTVREIEDALNITRPVSAIIVTKTERSAVGREIEAMLRERFGALVATQTVRKSIRVAEAPGHGVPLSYYDPAGPASRDYAALADELAITLAFPAPTGAPASIQAGSPAAASATSVGRN